MIYKYVSKKKVKAFIISVTPGSEVDGRGLSGLSGRVPNTNKHSMEGSNPIWLQAYENEWYKNADEFRYYYIRHKEVNQMRREQLTKLSLFYIIFIIIIESFFCDFGIKFLRALPLKFCPCLILRFLIFINT